MAGFYIALGKAHTYHKGRRGLLGFPSFHEEKRRIDLTVNGCYTTKCTARLQNRDSISGFLFASVHSYFPIFEKPRSCKVWDCSFHIFTYPRPFSVCSLHSLHYVESSNSRGSGRLLLGKQSAQEIQARVPWRTKRREDESDHAIRMPIHLTRSSGMRD